jgi:hypothetical protein
MCLRLPVCGHHVDWHIFLPFSTFFFLLPFTRLSGPVALGTQSTKVRLNTCFCATELMPDHLSSRNTLRSVQPSLWVCSPLYGYGSGLLYPPLHKLEDADLQEALALWCLDMVSWWVSFFACQCERRKWFFKFSWSCFLYWVLISFIHVINKTYISLLLHWERVTNKGDFVPGISDGPGHTGKILGVNSIDAQDASINA